MIYFDRAAVSSRYRDALKRVAPGNFLCILCGLVASLLLALVVLTWQPGEAHAAKKIYIKLSTLAPEGSSWMRQMRLMSEELEQATQGQVKFKFYPGGVSGDEKDVIRKMRIGQVHAAGFTGVGLGEILPEVRVLDLPFLFENDQEIAHIYEKMNRYFVGRFEEKGYILLGWVPVGWIHFFSKIDIQSVEDLRRTKAWMWEGDPLVASTYKGLKVSPHSLSITDVMLSLQTGMINTVYASPIGALALQWFTKIKSMSALRMGYATGGVLMTKKQFSKLPKKYQQALKRISKKHLQGLVEKVQEDNNKAIAVMKKNGLKIAPEPSSEQLEEFHRVGEFVRKQLTGKLFEQSLVDTILKHLQDLR